MIQLLGAVHAEDAIVVVEFIELTSTAPSFLGLELPSDHSTEAPC